MNLNVELKNCEEDKSFIFYQLETPNLLITSNNNEKTDLIKNIIQTLIKNNRKNTVQIALIDYDNKNYNFLEDDKHLFLPISHDKDYTDNLLKFINGLKTSRTFLFKKCNVKNIEDYNKQEKNKLNYVFLFVDELEFLHKFNQVELLLRIIDKARTCGIFVIVATNITNRKVITSDIKVNFINRITFNLKSKEDLKWILDTTKTPTLNQNEFIFSN